MGSSTRIGRSTGSSRSVPNSPSPVSRSPRVRITRVRNAHLRRVLLAMPVSMSACRRCRRCMRIISACAVRANCGRPITGPGPRSRSPGAPWSGGCGPWACPASRTPAPPGPPGPRRRRSPRARGWSATSPPRLRIDAGSPTSLTFRRGRASCMSLSSWTCSPGGLSGGGYRHLCGRTWPWMLLNMGCGIDLVRTVTCLNSFLIPIRAVNTFHSLHRAPGRGRYRSLGRVGR